MAAYTDADYAKWGLTQSNNMLTDEGVSTRDESDFYPGVIAALQARGINPQGAFGDFGAVDVTPGWQVPGGDPNTMYYPIGGDLTKAYGDYLPPEIMAAVKSQMVNGMLPAKTVSALVQYMPKNETSGLDKLMQGLTLGVIGGGIAGGFGLGPFAGGGASGASTGIPAGFDFASTYGAVPGFGGGTAATGLSLGELGAGALTSGTGLASSLSLTPELVTQLQSLGYSGAEIAAMGGDAASGLSGGATGGATGAGGTAASITPELITKLTQQLGSTAAKTAIDALIKGGVGLAAGALVNKATGAGTAGTATSGTAQDALNRQMAILEAQYAHWDKNFKPLEEGLADDAKTFGTPASQEVAAGKAHADVAQAFGNQRGQFARMIGSYGINPNSGRFGGAELSSNLAEAKADALAQNAAREREKTLGFDKKIAVANVGKGIPQAASSGLASAASTGNALSNTAFNQGQVNAANARAGIAPLVSGATSLLTDWLKPSSSASGGLSTDAISQFKNLLTNNAGADFLNMSDPAYG